MLPLTTKESNGTCSYNSFHRHWK